MKRFRCSGCSKKLPVERVFARIGLARVCSVECGTVVRTRNRSTASVRRIRTPDIPPDVRAAVIRRDRGRCRFCRRASMHLHHIRYRSQGGNHAERNLICLCAEHHELVHSNKRYWMPILQEVVRILHDEGRSVTIPEVARGWQAS